MFDQFTFGSEFFATLETLDQAITRHDLVRAEEQQGQERPLPRTSERELAAVGHRRNRPQERELHAPQKSTSAGQLQAFCSGRAGSSAGRDFRHRPPREGRSTWDTERLDPAIACD